MQTDSEKDEQRGIQDLLRGIYTCIRNPRSHDAIKDNKITADSIIIFIDYLLKVIDISKLSFDEDEFLERVFDEYYVKTSDYSNLLVQEIPTRQKANVAITIILKRDKGEIYALGYFMSALFENLEDVEKARVGKVLSDELKTATDKDDIRYLINMCPGKYWSYIDEAVRLRTESILFDDFKNAVYFPKNHECGDNGWLATWITEEHLKQFKQLTKWTKQTISMLQSDDESKISYVHKYFWNKICYVNKDEITWPLKSYFTDALKGKNMDIIELLKRQILWEQDHPWWEVFKEELKEYPDIKYEEFPF